MKELIEKLKHLKEDLVANLEYNHIITINEAIQTLTSVKSESAEERDWRKGSNIAGWDVEEAMHDFANAEKKQVKKAREYTSETLEELNREIEQEKAEDKKQHAIGFAIWFEQKGFKRKFDDKTKEFYWIYTEEYGVRYSDTQLYNEYITTLNNNER